MGSRSTNAILIGVVIAIAASAACMVFIFNDDPEDQGQPNNTFAIILPSEQKGFTITSDKKFVESGGSVILSYSLAPSHIDDELSIFINNKPSKLDAMSRIHLSNIQENMVITVTGVFDKRENSIGLPEEQIGYMLTSSAEIVHHGESYILSYQLLPGYEETNDFGIWINNGYFRKPVDGIVTITDVRANHLITVEGISAIKYSITAGSNVILKVNGKESSVATVEDLITAEAAEGYVVPNKFKDHIQGPVEAVKGGYQITGDATFPSIIKVTAGENVKVDNANVTYVCPEDIIQISSPLGTVPESYSTGLIKLSGVTKRTNGFSFNQDTVTLSIYKVTFKGKSSTYKEYLATSGEIITFPSDPSSEGYTFSGWDLKSNYAIKSNVIVNSNWIPIKFTLTIGKNVDCTVNGTQIFEGTHNITADDMLTINVAKGYEFPRGYLSSDVLKKDGNNYRIYSDYTLRSIFKISYYDYLTDSSYDYSHIEGEMHTIVNPKTQVNPLFKFDLEGTGYTIDDFQYWSLNEEKYTETTIIVDKNYIFNSVWKELASS